MILYKLTAINSVNSTLFKVDITQDELFELLEKLSGDKTIQRVIVETIDIKTEKQKEFENFIK